MRQIREGGKGSIGAPGWVYQVSPAAPRRPCVPQSSAGEGLASVSAGPLASLSKQEGGRGVSLLIMGVGGVQSHKDQAMRFSCRKPRAYNDCDIYLGEKKSREKVPLGPVEMLTAQGATTGNVDRQRQCRSVSAID